jgi:hypothetical protein
MGIFYLDLGGGPNIQFRQKEEGMYSKWQDGVAPQSAPCAVQLVPFLPHPNDRVQKPPIRFKLAASPIGLGVDGLGITQWGPSTMEYSGPKASSRALAFEIYLGSNGKESLGKRLMGTHSEELGVGFTLLLYSIHASLTRSIVFLRLYTPGDLPRVRPATYRVMKIPRR